MSMKHIHVHIRIYSSERRHRCGFANSLHGNGLDAAVLASAPTALYWMSPKVRDPGKTKARILCIHFPKTAQMYFSIGGNTCLILPSDLVRVVCLDRCGGLGARTCSFQASVCLSILPIWTSWSWRLKNTTKNMYVLGRGRLHSTVCLSVCLSICLSVCRSVCLSVTP